jgi:pilus assembly protein CpaF
VSRRESILIAGGTGTGKTTLLEALLGYVPGHERVVLVEETPELAPACAHAVSLVARPPNEEGLGAVTLPSLLRAALRMRPDRIVVGEVRGEEALVALGAMSTGHPGSLLTVHASSAAGALERLVVLAGQGERAPSEGLLRAAVEAAIDVVVYLERCDGERRVANFVGT